MIRSGYQSRSSSRDIGAELRLLEARDEIADLKRVLIRLRSAVIVWAEARGLEAEGPHLHALLREVGRWPERDSRTEEERFVGAHRRPAR